MLSDFDSKKILEELNKINRAKEEKKAVEEQLDVLERKRDSLKKEKEQFEYEKGMALTEIKKSSIFSRMASIFHRGKYYIAKQRMQTRENSIKNIENGLSELDEKEKELNDRKMNLKETIDGKELPNCVRSELERVVITEHRNSEEKNSELSAENVPFQDRVLVHSTDFFPKGHKILSSYDGNKPVNVIADYYGVRKKVTAHSTRHEVHFTMNNRVKTTGAGEGNWDNPAYIIVDDYMAHANEMESVSASDAWTNGKSMEISPNAVILVDINKKAELPLQDDNLENYNIVYYDGEATKCLQNFLRLNQYEIVHTDANDASHDKSIRMEQEKGTFVRNAAINYMRDNSYNSRDELELSPNEVAQMTDIAIIALQRIPVIFRDRQIQDNVEGIKVSTEKGRIYKTIADFIVSSGMKRSSNGMYTFKSDDEIIENIKAVESSGNQLPDCVDIDLIDDVFMLQQQLAREHRLAEKPTFEEISQMPISEMFKFENQLACEVFEENLPEWTSMVGLGENAIALDIYKREHEDITDKIQLADRISYTKAGNDFSIYRTEIDANLKTVSDASSLFKNFEKKIQEVKDRENISIDTNNQR